ncbi:MAG TPA: 2OG-Fe(II) oxygenase, partial [Gammaproteobacteria bacterium]|nr:2OG-Fe(II) oxygenase [Gammaproteobacteria bacterium]
MIASEILARRDAIRESYRQAKPFRHVCLDGFLEVPVVERLLAEFPPFDPMFARNEMGEVGGKAVHTDLAGIGPAYRAFYDYMLSPAFLGAMSRMLGIPDLLFDPHMYGGGTHENLEGQELDPHIDFNYDPVRRLHRRLNLLVYLNKEWDLAWGGGIELHSNPRDWDRDQVTSYNCEFNRAVIFETNEHSWHGFRRIRLPAAKHGLSRKCISVYLYTRHRPKEEIAPPHGTFYVQRPLPAEIQPGRSLTPDDVEGLKRLLRVRDGWIQHYQRRELELGRERASIAAYAANMLGKLKRRITAQFKRLSG